MTALPSATTARRLVAALVLTLAAVAALSPMAAASPVREVPLAGWATDGTVYDIVVSDTTVYIGGNFSNVIAPDGTTVARKDLAAFDRATGALTAFEGETNGVVWALATDGTTLWVGGFFSRLSGDLHSHLGAVDATTGVADPGFVADANGGVRSITLLGPTLWAGGDFTTMGGASLVGVSRHAAATGAVDPSFTASVDGRVFSVDTDPGGTSLYIAGDYDRVNGIRHEHLVGVTADTGIVNATFDDNDHPIREIEVSPDGAHIAGAVAGSSSGNRTATWEVATGDRIWSQQAMGDNQAVAIEDGVVYFGFHEGFDDDESVRVLAADLLTGALVADWRPGVDSFFGVWAIAAEDDGVYIGGEFTAVSGIDQASFAFFPADTTPPTTPTGLTAVTRSASTVSLVWDPVTDTDVGLEYDIRRNGVVIGTSTQPFFTDHGLSAATTHDYTVTAVDSASNTSAPSATLDVTTLSGSVQLTIEPLAVAGSVWRYDQSGDLLGRSWREMTFADGAWPTGPAELGYGDDDEATVLTAGRLTNRFRRHVTLDNTPAGVAQLRVIRDDGIAVYVNGTEVYRENLPTGAGTLSAALDTVADEDAWVDVVVPGGLLRAGTNVIAAEVHNYWNSTDLSFDLELSVPTTPAMPSLSVADITIDEESATAQLTATLSSPAPGVTSAAWATVDGTATAGDDYTSAAGLIEFQPGETAATIDVTLVDDLLDEPDETFTVTIDTPVGLTIATPTAAVTLTDNDDPPSLSIADITIDEDTGTAQLTATLSAPSGLLTSANWATLDGTATNGDDYTSASGLIEFQPGETSTNIDITLLGDLIDEPDETFTLTIDTPVGLTLATPTASVTLTDNDLPPPDSMAVADVSVDEDAGTVRLTAVRATPAAGITSANWATVDGTATAGDDYTAASGLIEFQPGETTATIDIILLGDLIDEPDEAFTLTVDTPVGLTIATPVVTVTVTDNDGEPSLTVADIVVDEDAGTVQLSATLSAGSASVTSAAWATVDGTATNGDDYTSASGLIEFQPGETSTNIDITLLGDLIDEPDETFTLTIDTPVGLTLATPAATVTLTDNDPPPSIRPGAAAILEGDTGSTVVLIPVTLSHASSIEVTVDWTTVDILENPAVAIGGVDHEVATGTVTFAPGETEQFVAITVLSDLIDEPPLLYGEWGLVAFSNPSGDATIDPVFFGLAIFVIVDDDDPAP